ncbi:MAG: aspartate/glutamate racemase family protein [Rhodospirillales bacterium]|nr:aspartate/glutamate racemase family protein [Rhodospirillales bacterium]
MALIYSVNSNNVLLDMTDELFAKHCPGHKLVQINDGDMIKQVIANNGPTPHIRRTLFRIFSVAQDCGADAILNVCSSVGQAAEDAAKLIDIPVFRIDRPMAERAVEMTGDVGVLATVATTLAPTSELIERCGREAGKAMTVSRNLAEGAFEKLMDGDRDGHDEILVDTAIDVAKSADVIVFAQATMARLAPEVMDRTGKTVLTSFESGLQGLAKFVGN